MASPTNRLRRVGELKWSPQPGFLLQKLTRPEEIARPAILSRPLSPM